MIKDVQLDSDLLVRVHYPAQGGEWPVIVFSHGLGGSRLGYHYLANAWANRGFAVVLPSHREAVPQGVAELDQPSISEMRAMKDAIDDPKNWPLRPRDVEKVIDGLGQLKLEIDQTRIGVGGHSYGAYTTLLCAGADIPIGHFEETRAKAFVAISPPGNGSRGLSEKSWHTIRKPMLLVTGTRDEGILGEPASWRLDAFKGLPGPDQGLVVLDGAEHMTFAGGRPRRPAAAEHLAATIAVTSWFWSRHLRGAVEPFPEIESAHVEWK